MNEYCKKKQKKYEISENKNKNLKLSETNDAGWGFPYNNIRENILVDL